MDTHGEYGFSVRTYECGADGKATLVTICNYLQEAAALNAKELSFSKSDFDAAGENISWVLSRMRVKMSEYPRWGERVNVLTFPRGGRRITAWRDFVLTAADGRLLGVATTEWMLIDLATRKVMAVPPAVFAAANTVRAPVLGEEPYTPRLRFPADAALSAGGRLLFRAQHSQIDLNGHVNNAHYVAWLLEACPSLEVSDLEIVFRSETFAGNEVVVEVAHGCASAPDGHAEPCRYHRVSDPSGKDHVVALSRAFHP